MYIFLLQIVLELEENLAQPSADDDGTDEA